MGKCDGLFPAEHGPHFIALEGEVLGHQPANFFLVIDNQELARPIPLGVRCTVGHGDSHPLF